MSISCATASPAMYAPEASQPKAPIVNNDAGVSRTPQPTVLAALPPGQGTRIDQLA